MFKGSQFTRLFFLEEHDGLMTSKLRIIQREREFSLGKTSLNELKCICSPHHCVLPLSLEFLRCDSR